MMLTFVPQKIAVSLLPILLEHYIWSLTRFGLKYGFIVEAGNGDITFFDHTTWKVLENMRAYAMLVNCVYN